MNPTLGERTSSGTAGPGTAVVLAVLVVAAPPQLAGAPRQLGQQERLLGAPIFESASHPDSRVSEIGRFSGAMLLGVGQLVFIDGTSQQLIFVDMENGAVGSAGGKGDGPFEFRSAQLLARLPDRKVVVWDKGRRRFTVATGEGVITEGARYDESQLMNPRARPVAQYSEGALVFRDGASPSVSIFSRKRQSGRYRDAVQYRMLGPNSFPHVVAEVVGSEMFRSNSGRRSTSGPVVFGHLLLESQVGQHLAVCQSDLGRIRVFDRFGEFVTEIPMPEGVTVSSQQVAAERERLAISSSEAARRLGSMRTAELLRGPANSDDFLSSFREHFRTAPANDAAPSIDRMLGDWDGRLWLRLLRPGTSTEHWQVWDISGARQLFTLTLPEGERLIDSAGGRLLIQTQDEFGTDYLRVREMMNGSRGGR